MLNKKILLIKKIFIIGYKKIEKSRYVFERNNLLN